MISSFKSKQFISFLFAGGFAAIINFGSRFFYNKFVSFGNAVILAYITGMITAFILAKLFVFDKSVHSAKKEFFYFTIVNVIAILQTYIISVALANYVFLILKFNFYPKAIAHAIGVIFPVFTSFIGHKHISFRSIK